MQFTLRTAGQVIFGRGEVRRAPELVAGLGRRVLLVTGGSSLERSGQLLRLCDGLAERGLQPVRCRVEHEPDVAQVDAAAALCREAGCDVVLAVGGGSVIDCAKGISVVVANGGHILDYEGVDAIPLPGPPLICIPTTAGTAADISQFAIINAVSRRTKVAIISKIVVPDVALVDPETTTTMSASPSPSRSSTTP